MRRGGEVSHFGYGDTEIGIKYRFVHESDVFPRLEYSLS